MHRGAKARIAPDIMFGLAYHSPPTLTPPLTLNPPSILRQPDVENTAMPHRGKLVILAIFAVALAATALAVWFQYEQGRRALQFWGRDNALLISYAPDVELLRVAVADANTPATLETLKIDGRLVAVTEVRKVSHAPGFLHARHALIEDASFNWDQSRGDCTPHWDYVLRFTDGDRQALVALDCGCMRVRLVGSEREASVVTGTNDGLRKVFTRYFDERNKSGVYPNTTPTINPKP